MSRQIDQDKQHYTQSFVGRPKLSGKSLLKSVMKNKSFITKSKGIKTEFKVSFIYKEGLYFKQVWHGNSVQNENIM